jgi:hypothetical protein
MHAIGAAETVCVAGIQGALHHAGVISIRRKRRPSFSNEVRFGSNSPGVTSPAARFRAIVEPTSMSPGGS